MDFQKDKIALIRMLRALYPQIREIVLEHEANPPDDGWAPIVSLGLKEAKDLVEGYEMTQMDRDPLVLRAREVQQHLTNLLQEMTPMQHSAWCRSKEGKD